MYSRVASLGLIAVGLFGISALGAPSGETAVDVARAAFRSTEPPLAGFKPANHDPAWRLGRSLFFEPALSASGLTTCATCHAADHAWSDGHAHSDGDAGRPLARRTPTLFGTGHLDRFGWNGRFRDLAAVTTFAITSPTNMALPLAAVVDRLRTKPDYRSAFHETFGGEPTGDTILRALAVYVRSIESVAAPFDRWISGDEDALAPAAKRGFAIFTGKGGCSACHAGPAFTDGSFHDIGSSSDDRGRGAFFKSSVKLQYAFKTPSLRGVAERAPYMHDGSRATLGDVVELYDRGGIARASRADEVKPLHLSDQDKADLVAFLKTLSGATAFVIR